MAFLTRPQLEEMGFASLGDHVLISEKASIYGAKNIRIGSHVRIDDFCILSAGDGGIFLGNYIHIACFTSLIGKASITMEDFTNLASHVSVYSSSDDQTGNFLRSPMVPEEYTNVKHAPVIFMRHSAVGTGSVILPGVTFEEGAACGALSLITKNCEAFKAYLGSPARLVRNIRKRMVDHARNFEDRTKNEQSAETPQG